MRSKGNVHIYQLFVTFCFLISTSFFFEDLSYAADLLVETDVTVNLSGYQNYDNVTIEPGGTLVFNGDIQFDCSRLTLGGTIVISGTTAINVLYGQSHPQSNEWAMRAIPDNPKIRFDILPTAEDGADGNPGGPGSPGVPGYVLEINVYGHFHIESTETRTTPFTITVNGQSGGDGGNALGGGKGGDSGNGGSGGHLKFHVSGNIVGQSYGILKFYANGGHGGWYGGDDAVETLNGGGGDLGQGGSGGSIELTAKAIDPNILGAVFEANGGASGYEGGCAYDGDEPGKTMRGAPGGQITIKTNNDLTPAWQAWALYTDGGYGGICGNCSCGSCYFWNARCACHQEQNWTGQGGNGGTITVEARNIDNMSFYSRGGNGGNGLPGHNMMCQWDGSVCLWPSNNGIRIGNGGDGASAGHGGLVNILSMTNNIGDNVAYVLNGGVGGTGGKGGAPFCTGAYNTCCTICPSGVNGFDGAPGTPGSVKVIPSVTGYIDPNGDCGGNTPCYSTIQQAIDDAETGSLIAIAAGTYADSITLNESKGVILQGGWNSSFNTQDGNTVLNNAPKVMQGSLTLQELVIKPE